MIIWFLILLATNVAGSLADIISSQNFSRFNMREKMKFNRLPNGDFNTRKNVIATGVILAVAVVSGFFGETAQLCSGAGAGLLGVFRLAMAIGNFDGKRKFTRQQKAARNLQQIEETPSVLRFRN